MTTIQPIHSFRVVERRLAEHSANPDDLGGPAARRTSPHAAWRSPPARSTVTRNRTTLRDGWLFPGGYRTGIRLP